MRHIQSLVVVCLLAANISAQPQEARQHLGTVRSATPTTVVDDGTLSPYQC